MPDLPPNIVLIMCDQFRADCLGIEDHPVVQTPWLDSLGAAGVRFRSAYTACPVCMPARRTLMSGMRPRTHGVFNNIKVSLPNNARTLAHVLRDAGYQTHLIGKLHVGPEDGSQDYGFESTGTLNPEALHDGGHVDKQGYGLVSGTQGASKNGWIARPWPFPEHLHAVKRHTDQALNFLEHRDKSRPFFLKLSYSEPHPPLLPPKHFFDYYMNQDLPRPAMGDWARLYDRPQRGLNAEASRVFLDPATQKQYQAGYYAQVQHLDHEIGRVIYQIHRSLSRNTIVVFCSDHGEMLGDHQWTRKQVPYEGSARVPMLMQFPKDMQIAQQRVCDLPIELMDLMPTLLDTVGLNIPDTVEGSSLMPHLRGQSNAWREYVHGESENVGGQGTGMQYLTDGKRKYVWLPAWGQEQLFDLENDPQELVNLADDPAWSQQRDLWRSRLIAELKDRPEGFTDGRVLIKLPGPTKNHIPGIFPGLD